MEHLCRTCHREVLTDDCTAINANNVQSLNIKSQLLSCVPELQQDLVLDPVMCSACVDALNGAYNFKAQCLETEERIHMYFQSTKLSEENVTLTELYKQFTEFSAICNSSELKDSVRETDTKDFVIEKHELRIFKEEICEADDESVSTSENFSRNRENNINSECVGNITTVDSGDIKDIIKEEQRHCYIITENISSESVGNITTEVSGDIKDIIKEEQRLEDLPRSQSGSALKTTFSPKSQCGKVKSAIKGIKQKSLLTKNSASAEKPYECAICGFHTSLRRYLIDHLQSHTTEKPFQCNMCEFRTRLRSSLKRHIRIHTEEKPFQCKICEFRTKQPSSLRAHTRIHTGEKPFACTTCEFRSAYRTSLIQHKASHTVEKPFQCSVCEFRTTTRGNLKTHMRIHTGEKPFKCSFCEFCATLRDTLKAHMRIHTGEKPYRCSVCGFCTTQRGSLKAHIKTHRGV